jgi:hypothetical protein
VILKLVEEIASQNDLIVIWNYPQYNIDSEIGIRDLEKYYNLYITGILIDKNLPEKELFSNNFTGLVRLPDKIVVRFAQTIYSCS